MKMILLALSMLISMNTFASTEDKCSQQENRCICRFGSNVKWDDKKRENVYTALWAIQLERIYLDIGDGYRKETPSPNDAAKACNKKLKQFVQEGICPVIN